MRLYKIFIIILFIISPEIIFGQIIANFSSKYDLLINPNSRTYEYKDIEGSPYLSNDFISGLIYLKDSTLFNLPLRYNVYEDKMEFQIKGLSYSIGNPQILDKIVIGNLEYIFIDFIDKGSYFELVETGKCLLIKKNIIDFKPAEGPKPIEGKFIPASFVRKTDIYYILINKSKVFKINNIRSIIEAFKDQKQNIEDFIKKEKIKKNRKEEIIKIVRYYNSL